MQVHASLRQDTLQNLPKRLGDLLFDGVIIDVTDKAWHNKSVSFKIKFKQKQ
jgi:hypothetical protein